MIHNYRLIFEASEHEGVDMFDLDYMTGVLTDNFQASSRRSGGRRGTRTVNPRGSIP